MSFATIKNKKVLIGTFDEENYKIKYKKMWKISIPELQRGEEEKEPFYCKLYFKNVVIKYYPLPEKTQLQCMKIISKTIQNFLSLNNEKNNFNFDLSVSSFNISDPSLIDKSETDLLNILRHKNRKRMDVSNFQIYKILEKEFDFEQEKNLNEIVKKKKDYLFYIFIFYFYFLFIFIFNFFFLFFFFI